jgi:hypothetical protein
LNFLDDEDEVNGGGRRTDNAIWADGAGDGLEMRIWRVAGRRESVRKRGFVRWVNLPEDEVVAVKGG